MTHIIYPTITTVENISMANLAPNLSINSPPKNGKIIFGKEYTVYNKLNSRFVTWNSF